MLLKASKFCWYTYSQRYDMKEIIESPDLAERIMRLIDMPLSRRNVLQFCGSVSAALLLSSLDGFCSGETLIITEQAKGIVVADPSRCVACRRCELACTEFNDGVSSPETARIKVRRNLHFGASGLYNGKITEGDYGNGLAIQEFCKQCPHPVPCADSCPNGAIRVMPPVNARVIDPKKCTGCKLCLKACPWEMISFDEETNRATKCSLCDGKPKCVEACPSGALRYLSWVDLTDRLPPRITSVSNRSVSCTECHQ